MKKKSNNTLYFSKVNWIVFVCGILSIIIGYILLAKESLTLSPILLVLGYAILIPISLGFKGLKREKREE